MPELNLRDAMVLIGSLLILAVIVDAWRRMRQQRQSRVRVKLVTDPPEGDPDDDFSHYRELPNGPARVVSRDDLLRRVAAQKAGAASNPAHAHADDADRGGGDSVAAGVPAGASAAVRTSAPEPRAAPAAPEPAPTGEHSDAPPAGVRASADEPANSDWLDDLPDEPAGDDKDPGELPRQADTEVIILHVVARDSTVFRGRDILEILLACDLRFGDMRFFHRHEQKAGRGPIQFSVANMLQPGVFDIDNMAAMETRGLVFFLTLPGPHNMAQAFDYMLETAKTVARNLGGELLDESRSVLTRQAVEHARQQIRELERRLRVRGS